MSAEVLRRAASLMRERAEDAQGEWPGADGWYAHHELHFALRATDSSTDADADATYIASWHPDVALAVADWLDDAAENLDLQAPGGDLCKQWDMRVHVAGDKALAVARAYLGESP